jgi:hypothetical protein
MKFTIENNVPVPPLDYSHLKPRESKYPFDTMKPGDSIFIPGNAKAQLAAVNAAYSWKGRNPGSDVTTRTKQTATINGKVVEGCRIWRTR